MKTTRTELVNIWKAHKINATVTGSLDVIMLVLVWHFEYFAAFWILLGLCIIDQLTRASKIINIKDQIPDLERFM